MLYLKTYNTMYTALTDMICTLLQCNVCTCEPASVVEQLVKEQRSHPTFKPHMYNSLNHSLSLTVCMVLTFFLCRKSAPKVSHSSCTRSLWPYLAASRMAVLPSWGEGAKRDGTLNVCCEVELMKWQNSPKTQRSYWATLCLCNNKGDKAHDWMTLRSHIGTLHSMETTQSIEYVVPCPKLVLKWHAYIWEKGHCAKCTTGTHTRTQPCTYARMHTHCT